MVYRVLISKSARTDLENILEWYAGESVSALEKFVANLDARLEDLIVRPDSFGVVKQRPRYRKIRIQRFSYYVVYRIDDKRPLVVVLALVHVKRNPEIWIKRLRK